MNNQCTDDGFSAPYGAHVRSLERILDGDESLDGEGHRQPDAKTRRHGAAVHQGLTPTVFIEEINADVVQPHHEQRQQEAQIGQGQRRQIVGRAAQFQVGPREHQEAERVAHHPEDDDHRQIVKVEKVQTHFHVADFRLVGHAPPAGHVGHAAVAVPIAAAAVAAFTHLVNSSHCPIVSSAHPVVIVHFCN